jgi:hypothetical protein
MLTQNVGSTINISIDQPIVLILIQSTLNSLATAIKLNWVVCVVNRDRVIIQKSRLVRIRLFLLNRYNPVPFTQAFQFEALHGMVAVLSRRS